MLCSLHKAPNIDVANATQEITLPFLALTYHSEVELSNNEIMYNTPMGREICSS